MFRKAPGPTGSPATPPSNRSRPRGAPCCWSACANARWLIDDAGKKLPRWSLAQAAETGAASAPPDHRRGRGVRLPRPEWRGQDHHPQTPDGTGIPDGWKRADSGVGYGRSAGEIADWISARAALFLRPSHRQRTAQLLWAAFWSSGKRALGTGRADADAGGIERFGGDAVAEVLQGHVTAGGAGAGDLARSEAGVSG